MNNMDEQVYEDILDNLFEGVYLVDRDRRITYWNRAAERITGFSRDEVVGTFCRDNVLNHVDELGTPLCDSALCPAEQSMTTERTMEQSLYLRHKEGHRIAIAARVVPMKNFNGKILGAIHSFTDNNAAVETRRQIEDLEKLALLDPLTQLGNRRHLEIHLETSLAEMHRYGRRFGTLFMVDGSERYSSM
ncbi:MAG: PAS domain S-box protein [Desulfomonilaceae bacterium]